MRLWGRFDKGRRGGYGKPGEHSRSSEGHPTGRLQVCLQGLRRAGNPGVDGKMAPAPAEILPKAMATASTFVAIVIAKFCNAPLFTARKKSLPAWASINFRSTDEFSALCGSSVILEGWIINEPRSPEKTWVRHRRSASTGQAGKPLGVAPRSRCPPIVPRLASGRLRRLQAEELGALL